MSWNKFHVLNTIAIRDSKGVDDSASLQIPEADSISTNDSQARLQNREGDNKVGCEDYTLLKINVQAVRRELRTKDVQSAIHIFRPFMDDVVVLVSFNEATRSRAYCRAHICVEEASSWLGSDIVGNGTQKSTITLQVLGGIRVGRIEVVTGVLGLEEREKTTTPNVLSVSGRT